MAIGGAIKVIGLKKTQQLLLKFPKKFGPQVVKKSLRGAIKIVLKQAKQNAPRKTGKLRKGIRVMKSKIHTGRKGARLIGFHLFVASKGKRDPFYGRFQEEGWNVQGEYIQGPGARAAITARFGKRTGRKTQAGKRDIAGKFFIQRAWIAKRELAVREVRIIAARETAKIAKKVGL